MAPRVAIILAVIVGIAGLGSAVGWEIAVAAGVLALLASFAWFNEVAGRVIGATIVGALVLFAANIVLDAIWRPPILAGLGIAIVIFGAPAAWYLRGAELAPDAMLGRGTRWDRVVAVNVAALLAVLLIVDVPIIVARGAAAWPSVGLCVLGALALLVAGRRWFPTTPVVRWTAVLIGAVVLAVVPWLAVAPERNEAVAEDTDATRPADLRAFTDVRIVTDGRGHRGRFDLSDIPPDRAFAALDVQFSVGYRDGEHVRWTRVGVNRRRAVEAIAAGRHSSRRARPPTTRRGADAILVLLVDGTRPVVQKPGGLPARPAKPGEVGLWRRVSHAAGGRTMPAFALLQPGDDRRSRARLRRWRNFSPAGGAVSVNALRRRVITESAVALAVSSPTAQDDLSLAITHRPILLFDDEETVPRPLSVDWLFEQGRIELCDDDRDERLGKCERVRDPARLRNGNTHLKIEQPEDDDLQRLARAEQAAHTTRAPPAPPPGQLPAATLVPLAPPSPAGRDDPPTTIYVHPVSLEVGNQRLLYLDYWWYLSDNPVPVGDGALCGAGLVIARVTCHNHVSDWEGLTVVINRTRATPRVVSVNYGQHDSVVRYGWRNLRTVWDRQRASFPDLGADDRRNRPLAYVAKGSHATYPLPCVAASCAQVAGGPKDSRHNGGRAWLGNYNTNTCETAGCVRELPTTAQGQKPALWSAFEGVWGSDHCALTYYCDASQPPPAPGRQGRYNSPSDCDGTATITVKTGAGRPAFTTHFDRSRSCH